MLMGEDVVVLRPFETAKDEMGDVVYSFVEAETIHDVLVEPFTDDLKQDDRPFAVEVLYYLYIPASYEGEPLYGCRLRVRGKEYAVVGAPDRFTALRTRYNMKVKVSAING